MRRFGMRDEKSDLADHFLHGAVRVVEKGSFLMHGEFVNVFFAGCDRLLTDVRDAVLLDGNFEAVPMDGSGFWKFVFEDYADAIALLDLDGRAGADPVVAPGVDGLEGRDFALH